MTWTLIRGLTIAVVSAEDVKTAIYQLAKQGIFDVTAAELVPCVTTTRWARILQRGVGDEPLRL